MTHDTCPHNTDQRHYRRKGTTRVEVRTSNGVTRSVECEVLRCSRCGWETLRTIPKR